MATYNEIDSLPRLVDALFRHAPDVDLLVIDDQSPDGTGRWCDEQAAVEPRIACLHRPGKLGLGSAALDGIRYAIEHDYRLLINLDADLSHDPQHVPALRARMDDPHQPPVDVVIGSRYVAGGRVRNWPWHRRMMSRVVNLYARTLLRLPAADVSGSFRCYRVDRLRQVDWNNAQARGYAIYEEILWRLRRAGATFAEVPITFVDRAAGRSKINLFEAARAVALIARLGLWRG